MTTGGPGRRRSAPLAVESSDVTRFRSFGAATTVFVLTVVLLVAYRWGPSALATPGPLARPHRALACANCHSNEREESASSACTSCHGPHPSAHPVHAELARTGELSCGNCHAVHRSESGIAFEPDGSVTHYGTGFARSLGHTAVVLPASTPREPAVLVPLVSREACERCHDTNRATDPAWACFSGRERGRASDFSVCFDEHRRPAERSRAHGAERDAATERARELVPRLPRERLGNLASSGTTVALGAVAFGLVVAFARRRAKRVNVRRPPSLALRDPGVRRLPVIDAARCLGCQACVDACPYDVLEMPRYVAVVSRPDQCCGAGSCLIACPNGSLVLHEGPAPTEGPRLSPRLESLDRPGIFFAGDVSGGSLIRSALEQGVSVARAAAEELAVGRRHRFRIGSSDPGDRARPDGSEGSPFDLVVVGAGPAGLAAGLEGERRGLSVVVLEQASLAESIRRFSRDKLVLDTQPAGEGTLPLWLGDCKKEELLRRWLREVRARGLDVREGARVVGVDARPGGPFTLSAVDPNGSEFSISGRRVVVATGRRGSPRKLRAAVPEVALGRVHYELSDARAFAGCRAVVVGLGDVAMETALALALQAGTTVTLVHRGNGFSRGRQRNIEEIGRLAAEGRIGLLFGAEVSKIGVEHLVIDAGGRERTIPYDALFVHVGSNAAEGFASHLRRDHSS